MQSFKFLRYVVIGFSPFSGQNRVILGGRGGPRNFFFIGILLFLLLRSPCKVSNSYDMPLLGFSNGGNKKKEKEKYAKFPLAPMGVLAPGSAHARPSAQKSYLKFRNPRTKT